MLHFFSLNFIHILVFTMYVCNKHNTSSDEYRLCCVHILLISLSLHADILQKSLFSGALRNRTFCTIILINIFSLHSSLRVRCRGVSHYIFLFVVRLDFEIITSLCFVTMFDSVIWFFFYLLWEWYVVFIVLCSFKCSHFRHGIVWYFVQLQN